MANDTDNPPLSNLESRIQLSGHPIHVMLVSFPIALVCATLGGDVFYWWSGDAFFARVSLWTSGWGFALGVAAALSGAAELLAVRGMRRRSEPWGHAVAAMVMLAVIGANWALRLVDSEGAVLPWGFFLSVLGLGLVLLAGWHGGKLVFEHQFAVTERKSD